MVERTKEIINEFNMKNGGELIRPYSKSDVFLLTRLFEKFIKVPINEFGINPLYRVNLAGYNWQCGKNTGRNLQTIPDKDMILFLENNIAGCIRWVIGDGYVKSDDKKRYGILMLIIYIDTQ